MDNAAIRQEIEQLRAELQALNHAYYDLDAPIASDAEYDQKLRRLGDLEAEYPEFFSADSPTEQVGGQASKDLPRVEHIYPMLSLTDVFSEEEVADFVEKILASYPEASFTVEDKIDGLSLAFRYREGKLDIAHTRGDGHHYGENVSAAARNLRDLPLELNEKLSFMQVRAEVYMPYQDFQRVNREQSAKGEKPFANPRNSASGTMRQLDNSLVRQRGLSYFAFDLMAAEGRKFERDSEALAWLAQEGFQTLEDVIICHSVEEVLAAIQLIADKRAHLPYAIDGAVIKVDELDLREKLGKTAKVPRWAVAYKYPPEMQETQLLSIEVQVGRSGKITPVAILDPVEISGSTVSRASLHNQDIIEKLDLREGDYINISKSGDVIPHIISVNQAKRPLGARPWQMPEHCPVCGADLKPLAGSVHLYCTGSNCPAQLVGKIVYFASKAAMDIAGLGEQTVETLYEHHYLRGIEDIYKLGNHQEELIANGLIGRERRVGHLLSAINASKDNDLWRLICGLGIRHIGPQAAMSLANRFLSLEALSQASLEDLTAVSDIGEESAHSLLDYFSQEQSQKLLAELKAAGLNFEKIGTEQPEPEQLLTGLNIVVTGKLTQYSRPEISAKLRALGASVKSSVSSQTDYLIAGEDAGSKLAKAESLSVPVIIEAELADFLAGKL